MSPPAMYLAIFAHLLLDTLPTDGYFNAMKCSVKNMHVHLAMESHARTERRNPSRPLPARYRTRWSYKDGNFGNKHALSWIAMLSFPAASRVLICFPLHRGKAGNAVR
ncbi:hypothetical protein GE21DRAFT_1109919 [Neurospora crassa]|nr:hypothetical protein GE21DRAFT_1109919 [Neurospora crassa]